MAAFHTAIAFIAALSGNLPRHKAARGVSSRVAREDAVITRGQVSLLGWSYELKNAADYEQEAIVSYQKP